MTDQLILDLAKQLANERGYHWDMVPEDEDGCHSTTRSDYINDARAALDVVLSHFARRENVTEQMICGASHHGQLSLAPDGDLRAGIAAAINAELRRRTAENEGDE